MKPGLSVAIIGAGQIAGGYDDAQLDKGGAAVFTHAGAYAKNGKFSLETVCDVDDQRASAFQKRWGFANKVSAIEDICNAFHDVVSVCTPDATHYSVIRALLQAKCCKCLFVEKPIALTLDQILDVIELAAASGIAVIVNFQRRFDAVLADIRERIATQATIPLAGNGYYIKGLDHIGTTMLDTVTYLLGYPKAVLGYNKIFNQQIRDDTYEFVLFYEDFNVTVKTVDSNRYEYSYHIFELDLLMRNERICINDNSRQIETKNLGDYAYSGVQVLDDRHPAHTETQYDISMLNAVAYIYEVAAGNAPHTMNTPQTSYNNKLIIEKIKQSYESQKTVEIMVNEWKK